MTPLLLSKYNSGKDKVWRVSAVFTGSGFSENHILDFRKKSCCFFLAMSKDEPKSDSWQAAKLMSASNKCWLQLYCDLSSSAASDSLPQNLPPPTSSRNPASDSFSTLMPDPRPRQCVCVVSWQRGWICAVTASTDALIKYFSSLSSSCLSYWAHVKSKHWKKRSFTWTKKKVFTLWFCVSFSKNLKKERAP